MSVSLVHWLQCYYLFNKCSQLHVPSVLAYLYFLIYVCFYLCYVCSDKKGLMTNILSKLCMQKVSTANQTYNHEEINSAALILYDYLWHIMHRQPSAFRLSACRWLFVVQTDGQTHTQVCWGIDVFCTLCYLSIKPFWSLEIMVPQQTEEWGKIERWKWGRHNRAEHFFFPFRLLSKQTENRVL